MACTCMCRSRERERREGEGTGAERRARCARVRTEPGDGPTRLVSFVFRSVAAHDVNIDSALRCKRKGMSGNDRCVVTTVRRMVCYDEKSSKPRAKACAHAARGTGSKNYGSSALADAMLYCTQLSFFSLVITCGLWPRLQLGSSLQSRQSMRRTLVEGRSDAANARVARHWYGLQPSRRPGH